MNPELRERLISLLETLNLRGQRCPICLSPSGTHQPICELRDVLEALRNTRKS